MTSHELNKGEYTGSIEDVLARHENPDSNPTHYPIFSDKKWAGIYHVHAKAMRLMEIKREEDKIEQLNKARSQIINVIVALKGKKEEKIEKIREEKDRLSLVSIIQSGNQKKIIQSISDCDYSAFDDNYIVWLWNSTLYFSKKAPTKNLRNNSTITLNIIRPIMIERGLPLAGNELQNRISLIPQDEINLYAKSITKVLR